MGNEPEWGLKTKVHDHIDTQNYATIKVKQEAFIWVI